MRTRTIIGALAAGLLPALSITGCGGGGGGDPSSTNPPVPNASPGGIWRGAESVTGREVIGLIAETGEAHFIRADDVQFVGDVTTSGNSLSGNGEAFEPFGSTFPDGSTHGTGSVKGTIQERTSITGTTEFMTDNGTPYNGTISLRFDGLYNEGSSLSRIAGNYTDSLTGVVVSVNSNGDVTAQNPANGCVVNGIVSLINASYNAYHVSVTYANCQGAAAALNGVEFSGLATLDDTVSPELAYVGLTGTGATKYAVVLTLVRS